MAVKTIEKKGVSVLTCYHQKQVSFSFHKKLDSIEVFSSDFRQNYRDCKGWFAKELRGTKKCISFFLKKDADLDVGKRAKSRYFCPRKSWLCEHKLKPRETRMGILCHIAGIYRRAAHQACNLFVKKNFTSHLQIIS